MKDSILTSISEIVKRDSQRQFRNVALSVLEVLESIKNKFPAENERYFEI